MDWDEETKLKLMGLRLVADDLDKQLRSIVRAAATLVGEQLDENDYGHAADFAYDRNMSPEDLWRKTAELREKKGAT